MMKQVTGGGDLATVMRGNKENSGVEGNGSGSGSTGTKRKATGSSGSGKGKQRKV